VRRSILRAAVDSAPGQLIPYGCLGRAESHDPRSDLPVSGSGPQVRDSFHEFGRRWDFAKGSV
jgi:hypothetical protein